MIIRIFLACLAFSIANANANSISQEQVTKDISFLADDNMVGRASFSPENDKAADYISQRFDRMGLSPLIGNDNFKQTFHLFQIKTEKIEVELNGKTVTSINALLFTNHETLNWTEKSPVKVINIKASDDFARSLSEINQLSENILIIADKSHAEIFGRYHNYFSRAQNKFKLNHGPSALLILSSQTSVESFKITTVSNVIKRILTNVVGVLPGKNKADEMVIFSAHYDHLGDAKSKNDKQDNLVNMDTIYNGADDDASGTSAVINLAEYFAQMKNNQRSLVFVAFAAEELGGFGSKYFSEKLNPDKIMAMLNIEMIGKPSKFGAGELWMTGFKRSDLAAILNKNLKNKQIHADPYPEQQLFYRSDNATLARLGVPAHSFSSTQIDKDHHYHKVSDELETLDLNSMTSVIQSLAEAVETLVDGTDTPTRIDTQQVRKTGKYF